MDNLTKPREPYEISQRFRILLAQRIDELERDAAHDEKQTAALFHPDHIRRHRRLVALQRTEAARLRSFLDSTRVREIA